MLSRRVGEALLALLPELCPLFPSPTHHRAPTLGKTVFLKTGPWGEKDWGPLCYCIYGLIQGGGEEATHSLRGPMNLNIHRSPHIGLSNNVLNAEKLQEHPYLLESTYFLSIIKIILVTLDNIIVTECLHLTKLLFTSQLSSVH